MVAPYRGLWRICAAVGPSGNASTADVVTWGRIAAAVRPRQYPARCDPATPRYGDLVNAPVDAVDVKYRGAVDLSRLPARIRRAAASFSESATIRRGNNAGQFAGHLLPLLRTSPDHLRRIHFIAFDGAVLQSEDHRLSLLDRLGYALGACRSGRCPTSSPDNS